MPCEIVFNYHSEGKLKVWTSVDQPAPDNNKFQMRKYGRPENLIIYEPLTKENEGKPQEGEKFTASKVYLTLQSESYLKLDITYNPKVNDLRKYILKGLAAQKLYKPKTTHLKSATEKISEFHHHLHSIQSQKM